LAGQLAKLGEHHMPGTDQHVELTLEEATGICQ
jgi:hypothetical protein